VDTSEPRERPELHRTEKLTIVSTVFASVAASVPSARRWAGDQLRRAGVSAELVERAELLISEIVTNSVRHAAGDRFTVRLEAASTSDSAVASTIEMSVHDRDPKRPRPRNAGPWDPDGRGLALLEALSDEWGTRSASVGKWVWFRLARR
jgi:anti-sigma regulatory factor (Ser/Thr protein kinase)